MRIKSHQRRRRLIRSLAWAVLAAGGVRAQDMQWLSLMQTGEPTLITINGLPQPRLGLRVEGDQEQSTVNGSTSTYSQLSVTPTVGAEMSGSIYHPNLCTYNLNGDFGWGWDNTTTDAPGDHQTQNNSSKLNDYLAQFNILEEKPCNGTAFASHDHTRQDYSSFDTMTVDDTRYGSGFNWFSDRTTVNATAGYWDEKNTGLTGYSQLSQEYFNLIGVNHRVNGGQTSLTAQANLYENTLGQGNTQDSRNYGIGLSDAEMLGEFKNITVATSGGYSHAEYTGQSLDIVTASENLTVHHTPNLDSFGTLNYNHSDYTAGSDDRLQGVYGLHHQLYDSLASVLNAHGYYENTDSTGGNSASYDSYGVTGAEDYTKRLGVWGHLTSGVSLSVDHQDNYSSSSLQTTIDEPHTLTLTGPPVYLDHPNVIMSSVVVRGPGGVVATVNVDYSLVPVGDLTQIVLIPTSTVLHNGDVVLVTYESNSAYTASYDTISGSFQFRLDLYDHFGIYTRLTWSDNDAPANVQTQTLTDWITGVDYVWNYLRTGLEYEDYVSSYTSYQAVRVFQTLTFRPSKFSTLGLNLNGSTYQYSSGGNQNQAQFLGHYNIQLQSSLSWFAEAGAIYQDYSGSDQWAGTARTGLSWTHGKLSARAGYDFNDQNINSGSSSQEFIRNHFFMDMKRTF
jgi:hypothetical protein